MLEQLARDKEEKAARFQTQKEERDRASDVAKRIKLETQAATQAQKDAAKLAHARLQFRLPDGSTVTNQFSSSDTLQTAHDYLQQQTNQRLGHVSLSTTYPKRDFDDSNMSQSLLTLELAPSAVIIVVPSRKKAVSRQPASDEGGLTSLLMAPFYPLLLIWRLMATFLFGAPTPPRGETGAQAPGATPAHQQADDTPSTSQPSGARQRPQSSYGLRSRQQGNMHRLTAEEDEDDSATWNGNSTQQM